MKKKFTIFELKEGEFYNDCNYCRLSSSIFKLEKGLLFERRIKTKWTEVAVWSDTIFVLVNRKTKLLIKEVK